MSTMSRRGMLLGSAALVAGCAETSRFLAYDGPAVTGILLFKQDRQMMLLQDSQVLKRYEFELGFAPLGPKQVEGDGRTPEGQYWIDRRNPNSAYHLSLGISYPNADDVARARAIGRPPGGEIFIHGTPERYLGARDWTVGCIAVTNEEIEEIYSMVTVGTPIWIMP